MTARSDAAGVPFGWLAAAMATGVAAAATLLYWPALAAGFVGDDFMILHRLRALETLADAGRYFRAEFFEYYRPLGFLSHATDWLIAGADSRQFHRTNVGLHATNSVLVFLIARTLAGTRDPGALVAGVTAGLLFALDASNHEPVVWMSARFDLLATLGALAALWWMVERLPGDRWVPALLFACALLSKESTVALPIAAAAWTVFVRREDTGATIARVAPWIAALLLYATLRELGGGVPAAGGANRLPKLIAFGGVFTAIVAGAGGRWVRVREWLLAHTGLVIAMLAIAFGLAASLAAMSFGRAGEFAREKLSVLGFVLYYLLTPMSDVPAGTAGPLLPLHITYQRAALLGIPLVLVALWRLREPLLRSDRAWFLAALMIAALLPISALTEGRRYLYLPSAIVAVATGLGVSYLQRRARQAALAAIVAWLAWSTVAVGAKIRDWRWAGEMTRNGAGLVDASIAPACGEGDVLFLTSPVAVRGVYTHFYYETFEPVRGCMPRNFQILARVTRVETAVQPVWTAPGRIEISIPGYRGNVALSKDLRRFDVVVEPQPGDTIVDTPIGRVTGRVRGSDLTLIVDLSRPREDLPAVFYYSAGAIQRLRSAGN